MMSVIRYTNDKNMYSLCSDNVKHDYDFVKFIITNFSRDYNFLTMVVNEYLSHIDKEDASYLEICILMGKIAKDNNWDEFRYDLIATGIYSELTIEIEVAKRGNLDIEIGKEFIYIQTLYNGNDTILKYFAKRFLGEIFSSESNYTLEEIVHRKFSSVEKLEKFGEKQFLLEHIATFDEELSCYVQCHIELIEELYKYLKVIKANWDNYLQRINSVKLDAFYSEVCRYVDSKNEEGCYFSFSIDQIIKYVSSQLCLEELFESYQKRLDEIDYFKYDECDIGQLYEDYEEFDSLFLEAERKLNAPIDIKKLNINELVCLRDLTSFARDLFKVDCLDCPTYIEEEKEETKKEQKLGKAKIIEFDFKNKKF